MTTVWRRRLSRAPGPSEGAGSLTGSHVFSDPAEKSAREKRASAPTPCPPRRGGPRQYRSLERAGDENGARPAPWKVTRSGEGVSLDVCKWRPEAVGAPGVGRPARGSFATPGLGNPSKADANPEVTSTEPAATAREGCAATQPNCLRAPTRQGPESRSLATSCDRRPSDVPQDSYALPRDIMWYDPAIYWELGGVSTAMTSIDELETKLRDLINEPRRHANLRSDSHRFSKLCSALDVIGDTAAALDAYSETSQTKPPIGEAYLRTYGALQALIVQQDALQHVAESLAIDFSMPADLRQIREIRNDSVGHPSRRGKEPGRAFNHISRPTLSHKGFDLVTLRPGDPPQHRTVDLLSLIEKQRVLAAAALRSFVQEEINREVDHRRRFRGTPLIAALPGTLDYTLQKVREEVTGSRSLGIAAGLIDSVSEAIGEFERQLTDRGELPAIEDVFSYHARPARHAILKLQKFYARDNEAAVTAVDAETILFRLRHEIEELRKLAREIDSSYASDPRG